MKHGSVQCCAQACFIYTRCKRSATLVDSTASCDTSGAEVQALGQAMPCSSIPGKGSTLWDPQWWQWDPDVTVAALAYADSLVLCRVRPTFKAIASLAIPVSLLKSVIKILTKGCAHFERCQDEDLMAQALLRLLAYAQWWCQLGVAASARFGYSVQ